MPEQLQAHIKMRKNEITLLRGLFVQVEQLNKDVGLKESTMSDIQVKISSRIVQCEISIRDHEKLLYPLIG